MSFKLISDYIPTGDQPQAIEELSVGFTQKYRDQVLLGVTGSGKTFTIANVIQKIQKPTLVISPNKTLAAQLYQEFRDFFPKNAVSYFVSYYDYYQPEAYVPQTDTYIEKETEINEEIDRLRLQATTNLLTRKDCIVVASVSCIYNIGSPLEYGKFILNLSTTDSGITRAKVLERLTDLQYARSDFGFHRGTFRVKGETVDIFLSYEDWALRIEFLGNQITTIKKIDPVTGNFLEAYENFVIYPAKHYLVDPLKLKASFEQIRTDMEEQVKKFIDAGRILEAHRLRQKVTYDLEMIQELGYVNGIENYSRYFDGRSPGEPPHSLLEYFPGDYLLMIDESHLTIPQIRGMYNGDQARKQTLVDYGFRLPSALDNRPLKFDEFLAHANQTIYLSATPGDWEMERSQKNGQIVQQLIRPTGIIDPEVEVRKSEGQVNDLVKEIQDRVALKERILVTTLTKRMAEELTDYLTEHYPDLKVEYLHSDIVTLERSAVIDRLRKGETDVLVGINLLREGLDLPEVTLVAIIDADKEGFLRSERSLIQTMGRAARNVKSKVIMYADNMTGSMQRAIDEVNRRRKIQSDWNTANNVTPKTVIKAIREEIFAGYAQSQKEGKKVYSVMLDEELRDLDPEQLLPQDRERLKVVLTRRMKEAAKILDFESAQYYKSWLGKLN